MSSILEAWELKKRPIYSRLPNRNEGYENDVSNWLTSFWDGLLIDSKQAVDDVLNRQYDPLRCDENWLDYLSILYGWEGHWQKTWLPQSKRLLLSRSLDFIFPNKGNKDVLIYVFNSLFIKNRVLEVGSFIIGNSTVGSPIGSSPYEINIILPTAYQNSNVFPLVKFIVERFVPCWCQVDYFYDDSPFQDVELLQVRSQVALGTNSSTGIQI